MDRMETRMGKKGDLVDEESKFNKLKDSDKLNAIFSCLQDMRKRIENLEITEARVDNLEVKMNRLENLCAAKEGSFPVEFSVIMSNIPIPNRAEDIMKTVKNIVNSDSGLGLKNIKIMNAERMESRNYKGKNPPLVKVEFQSMEDKLEVLRNKNKLKGTTHKDVYIKSMQSHVERLLEINFKTMLNDTPHLKDRYKFTGSGRLVPRVYQAPQPPQDNDADK